MRKMYDPIKKIDIDETTGKRKISDAFDSGSKTKKCDPGRPPKKIKVVAKSSENKRGPGRPPKKSLTVPSFTKKPRGRPPLNTSGEPAEWDEESGTWIGVEKKKSTKNKTSIGSVMRGDFLMELQKIIKYRKNL